MQLKHASRYVHDLLTVLTKHMDMPSILYLLDLVSTLPPNAHTRQTLYLASLLIRIVWRAGLSSAVADAAPVALTTSPIHGPLTSSKSLSNFCLLFSLENKIMVNLLMSVQKIKSCWIFSLHHQNGKINFSLTNKS